MKKTLKISILILIILLFILMRSTCTGLWKERVSKFPSDFLSFPEINENQVTPMQIIEVLFRSKPDDYSKCIYIGFSGIIDSWR